MTQKRRYFHRPTMHKQSLACSGASCKYANQSKDRINRLTINLTGDSRQVNQSTSIYHSQKRRLNKQKTVILTSSIVLLLLCNGTLNLFESFNVLPTEASSTMHRLSSQSTTRRQPQQQQQQHQQVNNVTASNQFSKLNLTSTVKPTINQAHSNSNNTSRIARMMVADNPKDIDALTYLQRYGYMNESSSANQANLISEDAFHEAVMTFQRFAGIPETGVIDNQTVKYMQMPRCGNKDRSGKGENGKRRRKRYALQGSKWRRSELTYRISQYPTRFQHKKHEVDSQIEKAFKIWSQVAPIDFVVKKEGRVHIDIKFASGEHGDGDPFDGPGNTLAHAYFPQYGGDAHFDDQEYWTVDSYAGTNIFQVAAHELGHSLGLGHSSVREALMAPFYQKYKPNFKLHADDILGIQGLYGEKGTDASSPDADAPPTLPKHKPSPTSTTTTTTSTTTSTTTTTTTTTTTEMPDNIFNSRGDNDFPSRPDEAESGGTGDTGLFGPKPADLCLDSDIDAITRTADGSTYVFKGQHYWLIKMEGLASGYPQRIQKDWDGLPGNLDAALTWADGKTFFFKNDKYWRFSNRRREPGYPKLISSGFAGIPNNVDAAFVWSGNGKTYFFKGSQYWRFDSKQDPPVSGQYPKSIKNWSGLPTSGVDAAFQWENSMTYFFKHDLYYRFDDREFEVDTSAKPSFPRSTSEWWFGCTSSNLPQKRRPINDNNYGENDELTSSSSSLFNFRHLLSRPLNTRSSLSSLSSNGRNSNSNSNDNQEDWSFHKGIGEEIARRQTTLRRHSGLGSSRSSSSSSSAPSSGFRTLFDRNNNNSPAAAAASSYDSNSRWSLAIGGDMGEQSMSELKMRPSDFNETKSELSTETSNATSSSGQ